LADTRLLVTIFYPNLSILCPTNANMRIVKADIPGPSGTRARQPTTHPTLSCVNPFPRFPRIAESSGRAEFALAFFGAVLGGGYRVVDNERTHLFYLFLYSAQCSFEGLCVCE
jgi:hypothetical protein